MANQEAKFLARASAAAGRITICRIGDKNLYVKHGEGTLRRYTHLCFLIEEAETVYERAKEERVSRHGFRRGGCERRGVAWRGATSARFNVSKRICKVQETRGRGETVNDVVRLTCRIRECSCRSRVCTGSCRIRRCRPRNSAP